MPITRRTAISVLDGGPALLLPRRMAPQDELPAIEKGPFDGTKGSLEHYQIPNWFRDAKFGIWAHWGPRSGVEAGDWYARNMYIETQAQYKYQVEHYGHPSKVGYKDVCTQW